MGHLAITVAPTTIHDFVRVRRRRGKRGVVFSGRQPASKAKHALAASDWPLANQGEFLGLGPSATLCNRFKTVCNIGACQRV